MAIYRPFAYNTGSTISGTDQVGNIAIGVLPQDYSSDLGGVKWWSGPNECPGYVICHESPLGDQPNPLNIPAYVGFWRSKYLTDTSFIETVNFYFNQSFDNGLSCKTHVNANGYWTSWDLDSLYLDPGSVLSYSGSDSNWMDLSGNENDGVLLNGITYSPLYTGVLEFSAASLQYVYFPSVTKIPTGSTNYTINTWFNTNSVGTHGIIGWGNWGSYNQVNALRLDSIGFINYWWGNDLIVPYVYNTNQWYNLCVTFDGTFRTMYLDGLQIAQDTPGLPDVTISSNLVVGSTNNITEFFDGLLSIISVYPEALTSEEINCMYNSVNSRFISVTPTPTPTQTPTNTPTETPTQTPTNTPTQTPTQTITPTQTPSNTPTQTPTPTETPTQTPSNTPTQTITPTQTPNTTQTQTPTQTPTNTGTPTQTPTQTPTPTKVIGGSALFVPSDPDWMSVTGSTSFAVGTGDFTVEWWQYQTNNGNENYLFSYGAGTDNFAVSVASGGNRLNCYMGGSRISNSTISNPTNTWHHVAVSRNSGTYNAYFSGTRIDTLVNSTNITDTTSTFFICTKDGTGGTGDNFPGNITNFRFVKGTAVYTGATYTVPTSPLTPITGTQLLIGVKSAGTVSTDNSGTGKVIFNNGATYSALTPF